MSSGRSTRLSWHRDIRTLIIYLYLWPIVMVARAVATVELRGFRTCGSLHELSRWEPDELKPCSFTQTSGIPGRPLRACKSDSVETEARRVRKVVSGPGYPIASAGELVALRL